jgi:ribosomal protein L11 methyltransferase
VAAGGTDGPPPSPPSPAIAPLIPMSRPKYSRLVVPRKARDEAVLGIVSLYGPLGFLEEGRDLVACFRDAETARRASLALALSRVRCDLVTDIPEEDPLAVFRAASRPFAVGERFWIDPGDPCDSQAPAGRIALRLPASTAFGTGGHESTRLALLCLEEEPPEGLEVLDVGTGSGVLALAAAALGARRAVGLDTDSDAVFVARENLRRHPFGTRVSLLAGDAGAVARAFPLVLANLLPEEFLAGKSGVLRRVAPGGRLILSGLPLEAEEGMLARLRSRRWGLAGRRAEGEWACLCLERAS